jgi:hypothetical protein
MSRRRQYGSRAQSRAAGTFKTRRVMRIIDLGEDSEKAQARFGILITCAFNGKPQSDIEGARNLAKLQDALEDCSIVETKIVDGRTMTDRKLKPNTTTIVLNDGPLSVLKERFFGSGIDWLPAANRRMLDAYDAVCAAREVKPEDLKPEAVGAAAGDSAA